ncbi:hypothetical protein PTTG_01071, partial [Puccinia triticina 1-1 BBBD Race 1]
MYGRSTPAADGPPSDSGDHPPAPSDDEPPNLFPRPRKKSLAELVDKSMPALRSQPAAEDDTSPVDQLASTDPPTQPLPTPKRVKTGSEPATTSPDLAIEDYLAICKVKPNDTVTRAAMERHSLYHWSIFKHTSINRLRKLGIDYGPALLLTCGVEEAENHLQEKKM